MRTFFGGEENNLPKVLSRILLYMMALDFLWTILWVMAWYFLLNSRSLWVDSIDADLWSGNDSRSSSESEQQ